MGTTAAENIAIAVTTTAETSGIRTARSDVATLGAETKRAANDMVQASNQAATAENTLAGAAAKATTETTRQAASVDKLSSSVAANIGRFQAMGRTVDVTNAEAIAAYRAQGDALSANLVQLGATDTELNQIGASIARLERQYGAAGVTAAAAEAKRTAAAQQELQDMGRIEAAAYREAAAREAASQKAEVAAARVPPQSRSAANALGILTQAALTGQGSLAGMATAAGSAAQGFAFMSNNAKLAAGAAGIGALITVGTLLYEVYKKAKEEIVTAANPQFLAHIGNETLKQAEADLKNQIAIRDKLQQEAASKATGTILDIIPHTEAFEAEKAYETSARNVEALTAKVIELQHQEKLRQIALAESSRDEIAAGRLTLQIETDRAARKRNDYQLAIESNDIDRRQRAADIEVQFRHRDANGQIVALTGEEVRLRDTLLDQNNKIADAKGRQLTYDYQIALQTATATRLQGSENAADRVRGRLEEIELERQAEIQRLGDVQGATESAEQKKRALFRETAKQAADNAKTIFDVLRSTNDKTLKAVGTFGENLRRVAIGAEAARALVRASVEGAEAIASLAAGDFRGAALHGAAALEFGSAAALGARESLGGGGGGGGGGSAGSGAASTGSGGTFTPRDENGGGTTVVNLYTTDPYSRENIMIASYQLQRAGVTKRPIFVPPTNNLITQSG